MKSFLSLSVLAKLAIAPPHDPVGVAALIHPCGSRKRQISPASVNSLLPPSIKAKLTGIIESVARALRIFPYGKLQKIHVLRSALCRVRFMDGNEEVGLSPDFFNTSVRYRIFVAGVLKRVSVSGVDFLVVERDACAPIKHVTEAGGLSLDPDTFNLLTPARLQNLVDV
jgi:hypothetical protein